MKQTVYKSGSSLVVVVPSEFVDVAGVKAGDEVSVSVDTQKGKVTYTFTGACQLTLSDIRRKK